MQLRIIMFSRMGGKLKIRLSLEGASTWLLEFASNFWSLIETCELLKNSLLHLLQEILDLRRAQDPVICMVRICVSELFHFGS